VLPPGSQIGPITPEQRAALIQGSLVAGVYEKTVDRESAYEKLKGRAVATTDAASQISTAPGKSAAGDGAVADDGGVMGELKDMLFGSTGPRGGKREGLVEKAASSAIRSMGSAMGREIFRGVLGGLLGGSKRR